MTGEIQLPRRFDPRTGMRQMLIRAGTRMSERRVHDASCALGALALGRWVARQPQPAGGVQTHPTKDGVFADALRILADATAPLYLEFGVWQGLTFRWWVAHLENPAARFVGFDSFEGLPEHWRPDYPAQTFDVQGVPPAIDDPRVAFQVGLFDDTVPKFDTPAHDRMLVNVDCTLYTSTVTVLDYVESVARPGDLIYFDELPEYDHELRALFEHDTRIDMRLMPIAQSRGYYWLFQYV